MPIQQIFTFITDNLMEFLNRKNTENKTLATQKLLISKWQHTTLLEKYPTFLFPKTWWISVKRTYKMRP